GGSGMDEDVSVAAGAGARFVEQARPAGLEAGDGGVEVRHAQGDVVQSGPALFEEPGDGRIGGGGSEQFNARVSRRQHGDVHLLGKDGFAMGDGEAKGLVEGDGCGKVVDGDAEVIDGGGTHWWGRRFRLPTLRTQRVPRRGSDGVDSCVVVGGLVRSGLAGGSACPTCGDGVQGGGQFGDAFAFGGHGVEDGAVEAFGVEFQRHAVGAGVIGLVDDEDIGDLHDAGFDSLDIVAHAGDEHDDGDLGDGGDLDLVLADADGFDDDVIPAGGVHEAGEIGGGAGESAQGAAGGHGTDEDSRVGVVLLHADAIAQNGAAGNAAGGVDGEDGDGLA